MRQILTRTGKILLLILIAALTFVTVLLSIFNPFYYKKVFRNINRKASDLMNAFFSVNLEEDTRDNTGEYFGLVITLAGIIILSFSLRAC